MSWIWKKLLIQVANGKEIHIYWTPNIHRIRLLGLLGTFVRKYRRLGGLNNRNVVSHSSGGWKSKIKVPAGLVSSEASLLGV